MLVSKTPPWAPSPVQNGPSVPSFCSWVNSTSLIKCSTHTRNLAGQAWLQLLVGLYTLSNPSSTTLDGIFVETLLDACCSPTPYFADKGGGPVGEDRICWHHAARCRVPGPEWGPLSVCYPEAPKLHWASTGAVTFQFSPCPTKSLAHLWLPPTTSLHYSLRLLTGHYWLLCLGINLGGRK